MSSRSLIAGGRQSAWTGVGAEKFISSRLRKTGAGTYSSLHADMSKHHPLIAESNTITVFLALNCLSPHFVVQWSSCYGSVFGHLTVRRTVQEVWRASYHICHRLGHFWGGLDNLHLTDWPSVCGFIFQCLTLSAEWRLTTTPILLISRKWANFGAKAFCATGPRVRTICQQT